MGQVTRQSASRNMETNVITTFTRYRKYIIPALLVGSLGGGLALSQGGLAIAQNGFGGMHGFMHTPPSPEAIKRLQDGEIAGAIAALKMSDDQLKLWAPVEKLIRDQQAERLKALQDRIAATANGATPPAAPALTDRLDKMAEQAGKRAEQLKAFAAAFKPFYATLSDPQKEVVGPLLAHLDGGGRGRGHGGDGPGGFGRGHHGKHGGQQDGGPGPDGNQ